MDLRNIINNDVADPPPTRKPPAKASPSSASKSYPQSAIQSHPPTSALSYSPPGARRETFPLVPHQSPPAGRPYEAHTPNGQVSYASGVSPYAAPPSSNPASHAGSQFPFPSAFGSSLRGHSPPSYSYTHASDRGSHGHTNGHSYGQPSPAVLTPLSSASGSSSHPYQHPRPSSRHSATPTSAHSSHAYHRESPSGPTYGGSSSMSMLTHGAPPASHPSYAENMQAASPDTRQSPVQRPDQSLPPSLHTVKHHSSGDASGPSPSSGPGRWAMQEHKSPVLASPVPQTSRSHATNQHLQILGFERDRSLSVSPKTVVPIPLASGSGPAAGGARPALTGSELRSGVVPSRYEPMTPDRSSITAYATDERTAIGALAKNDGARQVSSEGPRPSIEHATSSPKQPTERVAPAESPEPAAPRRRPRPTEPPIWARKANSGTRLKINKVEKTPNIAAPAPAATHTSPAVAVPDPVAAAAWESSILNVIPTEELTKLVADFLFCHVVDRPEPIGAKLEIEAKIGQLIDRNTNDRLRLPVMTECVVSKDDPNLHVAFHSSMTEDQHRALNRFLNEALKQSMGPPRKSVPTPSTSPPVKPRVAMSYVHTREIDGFYDLPGNAEASLPPMVRGLFANRPGSIKPRIRVTVDQKTGAELARIIKVRQADLDVHCPQTPFDWRLSVNLEIEYAGHSGELVEATEGGRKVPKRNKDRLTYRHQAYQIDLTQVTTTTPAPETKGAKPGPPRVEKEHELEIEIDAARLRSEGQAIREGKPSLYEDVVRSFVDNMRILTRHCRP